MEDKDNSRQTELDKTQTNNNFDLGLQLRILEIISDNFDETIVFNEVKQKLGLKEIDKESKTYKDLIHYLKTLLPYPSTGGALFHRQSNRLGSLDVQKKLEWDQYSNIQKYKLVTKKQYCKCCGLPKQDQQLSICKLSFKSAASTGISIFMFYRTMIILPSLLFLVLLIFGIYALTTNIMISQRYAERYAAQDVHLMVSSGNKIFSDDELAWFYLMVQAWLGEAMVIAFLLAYFLMQKIQITQANQVQALNKSASDFTVVFKGVPTSVTPKQIQLAVLTQLKKASNKFSVEEMNDFAESYHQDTLIAKINVGIPRNHKYMQNLKSQKQKKIKILEQEKQIKQKVVGLIMELTKTPQFQTPQSERQKIQKQLTTFRIQNNLSKDNLVSFILSLTQKISPNKIKSVIKRQSQKKEGIDKMMIQQKENKPQNKIPELSKTDVFVTFESRKIKQKFLNSIKESVFQRIRSQVTLYMYQKKIPMNFEGVEYRVRIEQASEPEDILWDNIGFKRKDIYIRKLKIFGITFLILAGSFLTVYALSTVQYSNKENRSISILISFAIPIFNFLILNALEYLTKFELDMTHTAYQSSLGVKTILAQLVNMILIPILVNQFVKIDGNYFGQGGIDEEIFYIGLINSFLPPILKIIGPKYIYDKYIRVWWYQRPSKKFYMTQRQLNKVYELMQFQNGIEYVYIITLYLFTCFYMSLQPIIIIFAICGYILNYWAQKKFLFHRCRRIVPGTTILYNTMVKFIYAGGLFYSIGSLFFLNGIHSNMQNNSMSSDLIANIIAIGLSVFSLLTPFSSFHKSLIKRKAYTGNQLFSQDRVFLPSEYDRMNPFTKKKALKDYIAFIESAKKQLSRKSPEQKIIFEQTLQRQDRYIPIQYNQSSKLERFSNVSNVPHKLVSKYLLGQEESMVRSDIIYQDENEQMEDRYQQGGKGIDVSNIFIGLSQMIQKQPQEIARQPKKQLQQSFYRLNNFDQ